MITVTWETLPLILLTLAVAVLGTARFTRLVTFDLFPPMVYVRERWGDMVEGTGWEKLLTCWWCFSFWAALGCIGWYIGGMFVLWVAWSWWIFWGGLALAYAAAMVVRRDGDDDDDE